MGDGMALAKNSKMEKWSRELKKIGRNRTKIIKHGRKWVEVGPNEIWIGQIDAKQIFPSDPAGRK